MRFWIILMLFLLMGAFFIISENKLALKNPDARMEFGRQYYQWFGNLFRDAGSVTGYVAKMDWLP